MNRISFRLDGGRVATLSLAGAVAAGALALVDSSSAEAQHGGVPTIVEPQIDQFLISASCGDTANPYGIVYNGPIGTGNHVLKLEEGAAAPTTGNVSNGTPYADSAPADVPVKISEVGRGPNGSDVLLATIDFTPCVEPGGTTTSTTARPTTSTTAQQSQTSNPSTPTSTPATTSNVGARDANLPRTGPTGGESLLPVASGLMLIAAGASAIAARRARND